MCAFTSHTHCVSYIQNEDIIECKSLVNIVCFYCLLMQFAFWMGRTKNHTRKAEGGGFVGCFFVGRRVILCGQSILEISCRLFHTSVQWNYRFFVGFFAGKATKLKNSTPNDHSIFLDGLDIYSKHLHDSCHNEFRWKLINYRESWVFTVSCIAI